MLLKEGIGLGYMPEPMAREDVEGGRLVQLDMSEVKSGSLRPYAIYRTDTSAGPGGPLAHGPVRGAGGRGDRAGIHSSVTSAIEAAPGPRGMYPCVRFRRNLATRTRPGERPEGPPTGDLECVVGGEPKNSAPPDSRELE
jgi:hypothetical protein